MDKDQARQRLQAAIQRRLDANGKSLKAVGEELGVNPATVWRWREGRISGPALMAVRLLEMAERDKAA